jgi:hypothetical protein
LVFVVSLMDFSVTSCLQDASPILWYFLAPRSVHDPFQDEWFSCLAFIGRPPRDILSSDGVSWIFFSGAVSPHLLLLARSL